MAEHRAGVVALLGRPNAGKSTLLNRLVGRKLAIVSAKPQTTRSRILGISSLPAAQVLWLDTPGLHAGGGRPLNRALNALAEEAAADCDVALLLVEGGRGLDAELVALRERMLARGAAVLVVASKSDLSGAPAAGVDHHVSGKTGAGVDALLAAVVAKLPEAPPFYDDPDQLTDRSLRWLAAECVREAVFDQLAQELPYSTAVEIESFDESRPELVRIRANLLVQRASQKRIVVGTGGAQVKEIGKQAREALEALLETRVHLELWVKVEPDWAARPRRLAALGYR